MEIHLITIGRIVQLEKEKADVEKEKANVEKEKAEVEEELHMLMQENIALKKKVEDLEVNVESAKHFSMEKPKQIVVCGDSHLKCISLTKLSKVTGINIEFLQPKWLAPSIQAWDKYCQYPSEEGWLKSNWLADYLSHLWPHESDPDEPIS